MQINTILCYYPPPHPTSTPQALPNSATPPHNLFHQNTGLLWLCLAFSGRLFGEEALLYHRHKSPLRISKRTICIMMMKVDLLFIDWCVQIILQNLIQDTTRYWFYWIYICNEGLVYGCVLNIDLWITYMI